MSNCAEFYAITFVSKQINDEKYYYYSVRNFLEQIEELFDKHSNCLYRQFGDKNIIISKYLRKNNITVIPIGKLKKGKVYTIKGDHELQEIDNELFEISAFVYDSFNKVALISKNKMGPSPQIIEYYFNSFIPKSFPYQIKLIPMIISKGLEEIRNAIYVRKVIIKLKLEKNIKDFYLNCKENNDSIFKSFISSAKNNYNSKGLNIVLGVGHGKKEDTLDVDNIKSLINSLDLNDDLIDEIVVVYKDGKEEPVNRALLKNSNIIVSYKFPLNETYLPIDYLLNNSEEAFDKKRIEYREKLHEIIDHQIQINNSLEELNIHWNPKDYYDN